jgi:hypothetical protein
MKVETLKMDPNAAREAWRKYQSHVHHQSPADAEIAAIYKRIAQGKTVIRALESIRNAGVNEQGLPKLAIARADARSVFLNYRDDRVQFSPSDWYEWNRRRLGKRARVVDLDWPGWVPVKGRHTFEAVVPIIPVHLRPKRGLANYHILWEAEWTKRYPVDPYLLRRFGGDAWLVVAAWDLTDVERAVMSSRLSS